MLKPIQNPFQSTKLISLDRYFDEMISIYEAGNFPKVLMLNGKKGIGKFTLVLHFLNYIYSMKETNHYNYKEKSINTDSNFYKSILKQTCSDVIFLKAEEGKNIKIDDIRNLKNVLSRSSLSDNVRFTVIDEVEFLNSNSANALLKTLEEPSFNNYFIVINNQQADLIETISSRCLRNNIYLNFEKQMKVINYFVEKEKIDILIDDTKNLTPGQLFKYNFLFEKYKLDNNENIFLKLSKLLYAYKKDKNKTLIYMSIFFIDNFFYHLLDEHTDKTDFLLNHKSIIVNKINDFILYNLNIGSVLNSIELKLKNVR
jgi:DNA polymerase III delta prime subunit